jgi:hypothetical protein
MKVFNYFRTLNKLAIGVRDTYMQGYFSIFLVLKNKFKLKYNYQIMNIKALLGPLLFLVCLQFFTEIVRCGNSGNKGFQMPGDSLSSKLPKNETSFGVSGSLSGTASHNQEQVKVYAGGSIFSQEQGKLQMGYCQQLRDASIQWHNKSIKASQEGHEELSETYANRSLKFFEASDKCSNTTLKFADSLNKSSETLTTKMGVQGGGEGSASGSKIVGLSLHNKENSSILETKILALSTSYMEDLSTTTKISTNFVSFYDVMSSNFLILFFSVSFSVVFVSVQLYVLVDFCRSFYLKEHVFSYFVSAKKITISFWGIVFYLIGVCIVCLVFIGIIFIEQNFFLLRDFLLLLNHNQIILGMKVEVIEKVVFISNDLTPLSLVDSVECKECLGSNNKVDL